MILRYPERMQRLRDLEYMVGFRIVEAVTGIVDDVSASGDTYAARAADRFVGHLKKIKRIAERYRCQEQDYEI